MSRRKRQRPTPASALADPDCLRLRWAEAQMHRLRQRLARLQNELSAAEPTERKHLAQALHASIGQVLSLCRIKLDLLGPEATPALRAGIVAAIRQLLDAAIDQTHHPLAEPPPAALQHSSLIDGVKHLAAHFLQAHQFQVVLVAEDSPDRVSPAVRAVLYNAIRELLTNAWKYSAEPIARVTIADTAGCLRVEVEDSGRGFEPDALPDTPSPHAHFGLLNIRRRCEEIGASFRLTSGPGQGTVVGIVVPWHRSGMSPTPKRRLRLPASRLRAARPVCPRAAAHSRFPLGRASI